MVISRRYKIKGSTAIGKASLTAYHACMSTKKVYVEATCIRCGKCAANCPSGTISMTGGRPIWAKGMGPGHLPPGTDTESKMHGREFPGGFDDYRAYQKKLAAAIRKEQYDVS